MWLCRDCREKVPDDLSCCWKCLGDRLTVEDFCLGPGPCVPIDLQELFEEEHDKEAEWLRQPSRMEASEERYSRLGFRIGFRLGLAGSLLAVLVASAMLVDILLGRHSLGPSPGESLIFMLLIGPLIFLMLPFLTGVLGAGLGSMAGVLVGIVNALRNR